MLQGRTIRRGTTLFIPSSRKGPYGVPAHSRAMTGAPGMACANCGRSCDSKTIFGRPFRTPFHLPGLSVTYLSAYSSLHCLWRYEILIEASVHRENTFVNEKMSFSSKMGLQFEFSGSGGAEEQRKNGVQCTPFLAYSGSWTRPASTSFCRLMRMPSLAWYQVRPPWK